MTTIPQIQHPAAAHTISSSADPRPEPCKPGTDKMNGIKGELQKASGVRDKGR